MFHSQVDFLRVLVPGSAFTTSSTKGLLYKFWYQVVLLQVRVPGKPCTDPNVWWSLPTVQCQVDHVRVLAPGRFSTSSGIRQIQYKFDHQVNHDQVEHLVGLVKVLTICSNDRWILYKFSHLVDRVLFLSPGGPCTISKTPAESCTISVMRWTY